EPQDSDPDRRGIRGPARTRAGGGGGAGRHARRVILGKFLRIHGVDQVTTEGACAAGRRCDGTYALGFEKWVMVVPSHSDLMGVALTMTDPTDTRDTGPRAGTPLWAFLAGVTVIGFTALVVAVLRLDWGPLAELVRTPLFWVLAVLVVLGELRPVMVSSATAVGGTYPSTMFTFAVLLHLGLPVAVLMQAAAVAVNGVVTRKAWHRVMFNIAQSTLALTAAAVVIGAFGHAPSPAVPWVPGADDLIAIALSGVAYFATRATLV